MMGFLRQILDIITAPIRLLLSAPRKLLEGSRRLSGLSLPARVAILTFIVLVLVAIFAVVYFFSTPKRFYWGAWITPTRVVTTIILVLAAPLALYKALQLWLEGDVSPYPDIDRAWKVGLEELDRQGIDLKQVPLFMVLGTSGLRQEKSLFGAAQLELNLREVPASSAAVHWYAGPNGIYLVCSEIGCLSRLAALGYEAMAVERSRTAERRQPENESFRGTVLQGSPEARGTSVAPAERPSPQSAPPKPSIQGTMIVSTQSAVVDSAGEMVAPVDDKRVIKLDQSEVSEQDRRLAYLARLIRRFRQPLCPINGVLTLLPFGLIQRSNPDAAGIERAIRADLAVLQRGLMIRCPVTALVTGIEEESGFRELVRRVGRERAVNQRFGKGFSVSNEPLGERLEALAIHACGSFEDFIYNLFRERDSLSKPGNTKLYALLCKVRHKVQDRLVTILAGGYACDAQSDSAADTFRFGGCYFAGTGENEERQAFVSAVLRKLPEQEEELQWTDQALKQDDKYHLASQLVLAFDLALLLALAGETFYVWFWSSGL
ncbi:MAG: type VI secretion protein IcmF/TssM N-terminal domain-containing protein [Thermoguttaceae bacterium]